MIKMDEDDSSIEGPEIGLSISQRALDLYNSEIDSLRRGDRVAFNSTLAGLGDTSHLHHLHTFGI